MHAFSLSATVFMLSASTGGLCLRSRPIICFRISHRRACIQKCASQAPGTASISLLNRLARRLVDTAEGEQEHTVAPTSSGEVSYRFYALIESTVQYFADFADVFRAFLPSCPNPELISRSGQSMRTTPSFCVLITFYSLLMCNPILLIRRVSQVFHLLFGRCKDNSSRASKKYQGTYRDTSASSE